MLVMLYHFDFPYINGGFVGVDVFFVISGFLITRIIVSELSSGNFSFRIFFFRRAKRIFPALIAVSIFTSLIASVVLNPVLYRKFGASLIASSTFFSNIYFYGQSGYFDFDAITKPLLHTWSLGVEEHFYIVFPLLLFILRRYVSFRNTVFILLFFLLASLAGAQWFLEFDKSGSFFISPFRFFEFLIGALLVFISPPSLKSSATNIGALVGVGLILIPAFAYDHNTLFPGVAALPICIGAAILLYSRKASIVSMTLGSKVAVKIGLISYSLYLVHWPLVVFYKAIRISTLSLSTGEGILLLVVTFIIASLVFRYIETPFRHLDYCVQYRYLRASLTVFLLALLPTSIFGLTIYSAAGLPQRFSDDIQRHLAISLQQHHLYVWSAFNSRKTHPFSKDERRKIFLVGDSQAADFMNLLKETFGEQLDISTALLPARCQAVIPDSFDYYNQLSAETAIKDDCRQKQTSLREDPRILTADVIVLSSSWKQYGIDQIPHTIQDIKRLNPSAKLIIVGLKRQSRGGLDIVFLSRWHQIPPEAISYIARSPLLNKIQQELINVSKEAYFIDIDQHICNAEKKECFVFSDDGMVLFSDTTHLTQSGAVTLGERMKNMNTFDILF